VNRRLRDAGAILCYHNVVPSRDAGIGEPGLHLPRERFERQMRWLADHYDVVRLGEFVHRMTSGASLRSVAAITFDDGYRGVYEHAAPVLRRLGLPATVFVVADAVGRRTGFWWDQAAIVDAATPASRERWLNQWRGDGDVIVAETAPAATADLPLSHWPADWDTIRTWASRGIDIGGHSATHRSLPALTDAELEYEIVTSRSLVHLNTGTWSEFFAYPYGRWDARVRAMVEYAGYRGSFTLEVGLNRAGVDPWCLRRINVPAAISDAAFEAWTAGVGRPRV
jgi:peptidoglycan/xylan/chitin deacetylase (PgdA/CDA1 family)